MAIFYCRHTNQNSSLVHLPFPGTRVEADDAAAAAQQFAVASSLPINTKILVWPETALETFAVGQVAPTTPPAYT